MLINYPHYYQIKEGTEKKEISTANRLYHVAPLKSFKRVMFLRRKIRNKYSKNT